MTVKRIAASVVIGLFLWLVLMFIHEEWQQYYDGGLAGSPPFNPFNLWMPTVLIGVLWWSLNAFLRWADKPEELPTTSKPL